MQSISKIYSSPNIFIFSLDRNNLAPYLTNIPFIVEEKISLNNFIEKIDTPKIYQLTGIISYYIKLSKYICFCVSPGDKQWYIYMDNIIQQSQIKEVLSYHNDINGLFIPCLLVYELKEHDQKILF